VWLGFRGGKGVATGLGVMTALIPLAVAVALPVFIVVVAISRYISLGSIVAALVLPAAFFIDHNLAGSAELFAFVCIACIFVIYKHKSNIKRIVAGEENRLGEKKA
jgi:glycerol-3-phosphate acyltransferase PlsY